MSDTDTAATDRIAARAAGQTKLVLAAADTATIAKSSVKRPATVEAAKKLRATAKGTKGHAVNAKSIKVATVSASGKIVKGGGTKLAKRSGKTAQPVDAKALAAQAQADQKARQERITKAKSLLEEVKEKADPSNWELARITFEATDSDLPGKMSKGDWASALGVDGSTVSRWIKVWREYGTNRQYIGTGRNKVEASFNDHVELTKVKEDKVRKALIERAGAEKTSCQVALRRYRAENKTPATAGSGKKTLQDQLNTLANQATADSDSRLEALGSLVILAQQVLVSLRDAVEHTEPGDWADETRSQLVRSVLTEADELGKVFEAALLGDEEA